MKYFKHSLIFLLLLGSGTKIQAQELTKKIHKEIEVSKDALIEINNSYGDLNITSWDQNKVVIDVLITVKGKNSEKNQKKLNNIDVSFLLSPEKVMAETKIDNGWRFGPFYINIFDSEKYRIDYNIKLPKTSDVDLTNDYGTIRLNSLEGRANINCDYGELIIGELFADNNILDFDYTSNSSIEYINGGTIKADFSDFEIEKAGNIDLYADYTEAYFNSIEKLIFKNDYGKLTTNNVGTLIGIGDHLTLKCGVLNKRLKLSEGVKYGSINIKQIQPSVESVIIDAEYNSIKLGIDKNWSFNYEFNMEYGDLSSSLALDHSISHETNNENYYKGTFNPSNTLSTLCIKSEYGSVKLNPAIQ